MRWADNSKKLKKSEYIQYEEVLRIVKHKEDLIKQGFKFINRANRYKKFLAYIFIGVGVVTLPLPTGSILLIGLGLSMLGIKKDSLKRYYKLYVYRRKAKGGNKIK